MKTTRTAGLLLCAVALASCGGEGGRGSGLAVANATDPDTTPPTVSCSVYPTTTGAWPNTAITCVFSEAIDTTTLTADAFYLTQGGANVPGTISWDPATNTATLKPAATLKCSSAHVVNVTTAVKDLAGNALASALQWQFTTTSGPSYTARSPTAGAAVGPTVTVTFNQAMDPATINASTFRVTGVVGTVFYDAATRTAAFVPVMPLTADTLFAATLTAGAKGVTGAPLWGSSSYPNGRDLTWTFSTTSADTTAPTVLFVSPLDQASDSPVASPVVATFSEAMDPSTLDSTTFQVTPVGGSPVAVVGAMAWDAATNTATFTPSSPLRGMTTYGVTISGARDVAGNAVTARTWTFSTASTALYSGYITNLMGYNDNKIVTSGNAWAADNGSNGRGLKLTWDVDRVGSHWRYTYMLYGASRATGKWVGDFTMGTPSGFDPSDLVSGWSLTAPVNNVLTDVTSTATVQIPAAEVDYLNGVTTMAIVGVRWTTDPSANYAYSPRNSGTMFILTFETPRPPVWGDFFIRSNNIDNCGGLPCLAWNANFATTTTAPPAKGNNGGWVLVPGVGSALPVVADTSPVSNVAVGNPITATFSRPMDPNTITSATFRVEGVAGTVTYDAATLTATFHPAAALRYGTTYTVTVDGARDDAGNAMAAQSWTVTTHMVPGDLDGDGAIAAIDADFALQIAVGNAAATGNQATLADVGPEVGGVPQPDGTIDVSDVLVILRMAEN